MGVLCPFMDNFIRTLRLKILQNKNNQKQAIVPRCSSKWLFFKKLAKFVRKTPVLEVLFDKLAGLNGCNFI